MKENKLQKKLTKWERWQNWLAVGLGLSVMATLVFALAFPMNGMTYMGFTFGIVSVVCVVITFLYSQQKRKWWTSTTIGTMMEWLLSHVTLGIVAIVFAVLHIGTGWQGMRLHVSWVLFVSFVIVVISGIWWRMIYSTSPKKLQADIRNYSISDAQDRANIKYVEIEKLRAGMSNSLYQLTDKALGGGQCTPEDIQSLSPKEQQVWYKVQELIQQREKHQSRIPKQIRAHIWLQMWRVVHIPASLVVLVLLPVHVFVGVYNTKYFHDNSHNFESSQSCVSCHATIVEDWSLSMHAHALSSPITQVQTRADIAHTTLTTDKNIQSVCVNCHAPLAAKVLGYSDPEQPLYTEHVAAQEGVTCVVCHQYQPRSSYGDKQIGKWVRNSAIGGWSEFWNNIQGGRTMYSFDHSDGSNMYHDIEYIGEVDGNAYAQNESHFCASCHNVHVERKALSMPQLQLQSIYDEWRENGQPGSCLGCHAEPGHSHQFIGVDYPLDKPEIIEKTRSHREYLLHNAVGIRIDSVDTSNRELGFSVTIQNQNVGHKFPSGFAFARQIWMEVVVLDANQRTIYTSGVLEDEAQHDLCDRRTMQGALRDYVRGCSDIDEHLLNLQFILQDENGRETPLQHAKGSVSHDRVNMWNCSGEYPMNLGKQLQCDISTNISSKKAKTIRIRLRLRNLPPYFVRAMNAMQPTDNHYIDLLPLISNLEVLTIASYTIDL